MKVLQILQFFVDWRWASKLLTRRSKRRGLHPAVVEITNTDTPVKRTKRPRSEFPEKLTWDLSQAYSNETRLEAERAVMSAIERLEALSSAEDQIDIAEALDANLQWDKATKLIPMLVAHDELSWLVDTSDPQAEARMKELRALPVRAEQAQIELVGKIEEQGDIVNALLEAIAAARSKNHVSQMKQAYRGLDLNDAKTNGEANRQAQEFRRRKDEAIERALARLARMKKKVPTNLAEGLRSPDRERRRMTYDQMANFAGEYQEEAADIFNMLAATLLAERKLFGAKSILEHQMRISGMPPDLYHIMVTAARSRTGLFQRLTEKRRRALKLSQLESFDLQIPTIESDTKVGTWKERQAALVVVNACAGLGRRYFKLVKQYLDPKTRMVDWPDNYGKYGHPFVRTCGGRFFICLPFDGSNVSVLRLAHEVGHVMHHVLSRQEGNGDADSFPSEVAAAVNEVLVMRFLLATAPSPGHIELYQREILHECIDRILERAFDAEFEIRAHELFEKSGGAGVTAQELGALYLSIKRDCFGGAIHVPDEDANLWTSSLALTAPHPCSGYLYPCAMAMAIAIGRSLSAPGNRRKKELAANYLEFLAAGSSKPAEELFAALGWSLTDPTFFDAAYEALEELMIEMGY